jgi:glycosyltransferase involved in cell wall biosynthesis
MFPYVRGGAEILVDDLAEQLQIRGHDVTVFRFPFPYDFGKPLLHTIEAAKLLNFDDYDKVISFKFPAYCIEHKSMVIWMFHQFRQVYDLWNTQYGLMDTPQNRVLKDVVVNADRSILKAEHVFTIAKEVSNRLIKFSHVDSKVIPHSPKNIESYRNCGTGDFIFCPSRITALKRQLLAVEALKYTKTDVKLIIAGICEDDAYNESILKTIHENRLEDRVRYENRWISDEEKNHWLSTSLSIIYLAYNEDSCGLVSMEAFYSRKPVITCEDSGGILELVDDHKTGYICQPNPQDLACAMDELYNDKKGAERMGFAAYEEIIRRDITWDATIGKLLSRRSPGLPHLMKKAP